MCARRFLYVVFFLTLLAVAGAFAIFKYGDRVLIKQAVPQGHFERPAPETGPDYRNNAAWLTRPGVDWPDNPTQWTPAGITEPDTDGPRAAVFYVHPTTYLERDRWNAPLQPAGAYSDFRTTLFLQSQASAFNGVGEIWAPRYRQAAFGAFLLRSEDAQKALDLAYSDVAAAFDRFLAENESGPIILAGHSQGALHLERLLAEKVAGKPVAMRIVAAYVVGWPISTSADLPRLGLPACGAPDQPGCILSWMSFGEPANPDLILGQWEETKGLTGGDRRRSDLLCVNPISGTVNGSAAAQDNAGTLVPTADLKSATLQRGVVGARCEDGLLLIGGMVPSLGPYVLPGNNYHVYDYALFWGAIRGDAYRRLQAWRQ
ncbi:MAG TPA: DUF3089 domain-containing protein [Sphingomicrobium sp.]|jgi:hypothetical protein